MLHVQRPGGRGKKKLTVAFHLLVAGDDWPSYRPTERDVGRAMVLPGCDVEVRRDLVPRYFEGDAMALLRVWSNWKMGLGMPFSGGWAQQPARAMDGLELCIGEMSRHEAAVGKEREVWRKIGSK